MHRQTSSSTKYVYKRILSVLEAGSEKKGPLIQRGEEYINGNRCREYGLTDVYYGKGIESYKLETKTARDLRNREYFRLLAQASDNVIARNLLHIYSDLTIPTGQEAIERARKLISEGYRTKKGKKLTFYNNNSRDRWKEAASRSFVEDNLELFHLLTQDGFAIPMIGDESSGGRIVDSFTLMPSWIRSMIRIGSEESSEADYSALHPNLIQTIYGGSQRNITHQQIADATGLDKIIVKTEHLSMFNRRVDEMLSSPLFGYYYETDRGMMERIIEDKKQNGYRSTSRRMFGLETGLMTEAIRTLNAEGIHVIYVYDALLGRKSQSGRIISVMNETARRMNISTTAK